MRQGPAAAAFCLVAAALYAVGSDVAAAPDPPLCDYRVALADAQARSVDVIVHCRRPVPGFGFEDSFPASWVTEFTDAAGAALKRDDTRWLHAGGTEEARYRIDLDGMAAAENHYDSAKRIGGSVYVDLSGVIAVPLDAAEGAEGDVLAIRFAAPQGGEIATALPLRGDAYHVLAREVDFASALVMGRLQRRSIRLPSPRSLPAGQSAAQARELDAEIELVLMDGPLAAGPEEIARWVTATALANADFWRGFPVERSTVVIMPVPGRANVPFGRVLNTGGILVLMLVGSEASARALYDEWVLVHEFIHLGSPYMRDTGAWLNEGLATYLEPIIRYRAGWRSAESVWDEWLGWMGRGVGGMSRGLDRGSPYWGGALFSLIADIELRRLTQGSTGLEDCIRIILDEGGDVSTAATTMAMLAIGDSRSPEPVLTRLAERHLKPGTPVDLDALFKSLGVGRDASGRVVFDDAAPLAHVRRWILEGGPEARNHPIPLPPG